MQGNRIFHWDRKYIISASRPQKYNKPLQQIETLRLEKIRRLFFSQSWKSSECGWEFTVRGKRTEETGGKKWKWADLEGKLQKVHRCTEGLFFSDRKVKRRWVLNQTIKKEEECPMKSICISASVGSSNFDHYLSWLIRNQKENRKYASLFPG